MQVARRSDMDMNGHINNVTYLGWALETVPEDIYLNYSLYQARLVFQIVITRLDDVGLHACYTVSLYASLSNPSVNVQVEVDYKAECMAGDEVESLGSRVESENQASGTIRCVSKQFQIIRECNPTCTCDVPGESPSCISVQEKIGLYWGSVIH